MNIVKLQKAARTFIPPTIVLSPPAPVATPAPEPGFQLWKSELFRFPGVKVTATYNPSRVSVRTRKMAQAALLTGYEPVTRGLALRLAKWAASQAGVTLKAQPNEAPCTIPQATKDIIAELVQAHAAKVLLTRHRHQWVVDNAKNILTTVAQWQATRTTPTGLPPSLAYNGMLDTRTGGLKLYYLPGPIQRKVTKLLISPPSAADLVKLTQAVALLDTDTEYTITVR